ncbi:MAG: DinB family protein [Chloroflexi bacterium]|nr:DinB family protein [Chloroflexota bacterium]MBI5828143.1 DinB family protein [Chloroflexota bacterium]
MDTITFAKHDLAFAQQLLDMVTADLTPELAHWTPTGLANPIAALYAHAVVSEDSIAHILIAGGAPLHAGAWAGKTGISDPQWSMKLDWAHSVRLDLPQVMAYAMAVHVAAMGIVTALKPQDLDAERDLSSAGLGTRSVGWIVGALLVGHLHNMAGEISALKGVQGARGYPF